MMIPLIESKVPNIDVHFVSVVATTAYPDIAPLFQVSTRWCTESKERHRFRTQETRVSAGCDLRGEGGNCVFARDLAHWRDAEKEHHSICQSLAAGELELETMKAVP